MPLFILPFDHRSGFAKDLLGVPYPYASEAHRARAAQLKELIYDAFLAVRNTSKNPDDFGILVDYETGKQVIADARDEGVMTIVSTEKSGEELSLLYEDETGAFLKMIGASYGKSLVKWKQVPETGDEQIKTLAELQANLDAVEIPHLIEPLFMIDPTERCAALLKTVELVHDAGVHPEVWKVEGLQSEAEWQRVKKAVGDAKLILLGRGEDDAHVGTYLEIAKKSGVVDGFAIGRTIFAEAIKGVVTGNLEEDAAITMIAENFKKYVKAWEE